MGRVLGAILGHHRKFICRFTAATTPWRMGLASTVLALTLLALTVLVPSDAAAQLRGLGAPAPSVGGLGSGLPGGLSRPDLPSSPPAGDFGLPSPSTAPVGEPLPGTIQRSDPLLSPGGPVLAPMDGLRLPDPARTVTGAGKAAKGAVPRAKAGRRAAAKASRVPPPGERRFVATEVLIGLPSGLSERALNALASRHRLTRLQSQRLAMTGTTFHRWRIADQRPVADVIRALESDTNVRIAQPNYRFTLQQAKRVAVPDRAAQYSLSKLRVPEAHQLATGSNVLVAVIDAAIDASHPEIAHAIADRFDAVGGRALPSAHGTAMAGAIAAQARLAGVAPSARILAVRAFAATRDGYESTSFAILRGIDWAVARGARVINMSFAGPNDPEIARSLAAATRKGVVLVAAAGNAGPRAAPLYPAALPNVIAVAAVDARDAISTFSVRGRHIAIAAPGVEVVGPAPGRNYQLSTGTSVAAAHVSGIAALLIELRPALTPGAVRNLLLSTARDLGAPGRDDLYGAGLADAYRAAAATGTVARTPGRTSAAR